MSELNDGITPNNKKDEIKSNEENIKNTDEKVSDTPKVEENKEVDDANIASTESAAPEVAEKIEKPVVEEKPKEDIVKDIEPLPIEDSKDAKEDAVEETEEVKTQDNILETEPKEENLEQETFKLNSNAQEDIYNKVEEEIQNNEKEIDSLDKKLKNQKRINRILIITIIILLLSIGSCSVLKNRNKNENPVNNNEPSATIDPNQGDYAAEELENVYDRLIAMPGWGGFTIPANTLTITTGFEFHNPEDNSWYEDTVSINGQRVETFIVGDSEVEINHLLRLVGIKNTVKSVKEYDSNYFACYLNSENKFTIKGTAGFDGTKEVIVELANGEEVTLSLTCENKVYYMSFALYLKNDNGEDQLLYQSGLVEPGKYIQKMELTEALAKGTYDAYVLCQPYYSDMETKTNNGIVEIILTAM